MSDPFFLRPPRYPKDQDCGFLEKKEGKLYSGATSEYQATWPQGIIILLEIKPCQPPPPPTPPGTLAGICNVSFLEVYSPPPSSWWNSYKFFATSFSSVQKPNVTFSQLLWTFSWIYWVKDNGFKTWTINLKLKMKMQNSLKSASLIEHFMRTLDWISVSLYVSEAIVFVFL